MNSAENSPLPPPRETKSSTLAGRVPAARTVVVFVAMFVLGAGAALAVRAAWYAPHADRPVAVPGATARPPMVNHALTSPRTTPGDGKEQAAARVADPSASSEHAEHAHGTPPAGKDGPVNTVCAICGMDVDPSLPTLEYQGKRIGFGCRMCPPKFKADPDRYGPAYLRNEVIRR